MKVILIIGGPGTGKTHLANVIATKNSVIFDEMNADSYQHSARIFRREGVQHGIGQITDDTDLIIVTCQTLRGWISSYRFRTYINANEISIETWKLTRV